MLFFVMILGKGHSFPLDVMIKQDIFHAFTILLSMFRSHCNVQSLSDLILVAFFSVHSGPRSCNCTLHLLHL